MSHSYDGLTMISEYLDTSDVMVFLKLYLFLYADDTSLLAESPHELQAAPPGMHHYCTAWKMEINTEKIKNYDIFQG